MTGHTIPTDLIERAIGGDRDAYVQLFRSSLDRSCALATVVLCDPERARNVVQEAYLSAWRDLASVRDPDRFEGWLRRLVVRACYDELRREGRHRRGDLREVALASEGSVADATACDAADDELQRGFERLDANERTALVVQYYFGPSEPDIADATDIAPGPATSRLNRAATALRAALDADPTQRRAIPAISTL